MEGKRSPGRRIRRLMVDAMDIWKDWLPVHKSVGKIKIHIMKEYDSGKTKEEIWPTSFADIRVNLKDAVFFSKKNENSNNTKDDHCGK